MANHHLNGTTVVCFGDSLTAGYGASAGQDYPSYLSALIHLPVINTGISGNTTRDALRRLDRDVLAYHPKLVIITLGANDFFQEIPKKETLVNMERIIERIKGQGGMVIWAAVQTGIFADGYIDDLTALADREHIILIPNVLKGIIDHPQYMSDEVHPNSEGYRIMAEHIYQKIINPSKPR